VSSSWSTFIQIVRRFSFLCIIAQILQFIHTHNLNSMYLALCSKCRLLRKIFGPKRDEVTGEWRKLHNEELCKLYCSPNINRVVKSSRTR